MSEEDLGDLQLASKTFNRNLEKVKKEAFRDGANEGHEEAIQKGFDLGYEAGFSAGEKISFINGVITAIVELRKRQNESTDDEPLCLIPDPWKGMCGICPKSGEITKESMSEAVIPLEETPGDILAEQEEVIGGTLRERWKNLSPYLLDLNIDI